MKEKQCVVLDGDDTIWGNEWKYKLTEARILFFLVKKFKERCRPFGEILEINDQIDTSIAHALGLGKNRFPGSWVRTYRRLCQELSIQPRPENEQKVLELAGGFWKPPFIFFSGVKKMLKELRRRGYYLVLLTAGDHEVQKFKVDYVKAEEYFDEVIIVPEQKAPTLKCLAKRFGRSNVTMVGNSARSDMGAAIKAGVRGVYVPVVRDDWSYHKIHIPVHVWKKYIIKINSLNQLLALFP